MVDSAVLLAAAALIAGWLARTAPGSSTDLREADPRYSVESIRILREQRESGRAGMGRSAAWFLAALRGDLGKSEISGLSVSGLLLDRAPSTVRTVVIGAAGGFVAGIAAAGAVLFWAPRAAGVFASAGFSSLLAVPSGLLALLAVFLRAPVEFAVAAAVLPRTYFYGRELFGGKTAEGWMLAALAAGIPRHRVFVRYLLPSLTPELTSLAGFAMVSALAVTIPAEVLSGRAGLGQLAWQSAMERDLPVVLAVTLAMSVIARAITLLSSVGREATT